VVAVLLDSGFLFASLNASELEHQAIIRVLEKIREPIVLPVPAITEITMPFLMNGANRQE